MDERRHEFGDESRCHRSTRYGCGDCRKRGSACAVGHTLESASIRAVVSIGTRIFMVPPSPLSGWTCVHEFRCAILALAGLRFHVRLHLSSQRTEEATRTHLVARLLSFGCQFADILLAQDAAHISAFASSASSRQMSLSIVNHPWRVRLAATVPRCLGPCRFPAPCVSAADQLAERRFHGEPAVHKKPQQRHRSLQVVAARADALRGAV
jgi:hypothetical protein